MRYALARIKALFVRTQIVFVPVAVQPEQNISEREQVVEDFAILLAGFRRKLITEGMPAPLADDMALQMHAMMMGADGDDASHVDY